MSGAEKQDALDTAALEDALRRALAREIEWRTKAEATTAATRKQLDEAQAKIVALENAVTYEVVGCTSTSWPTVTPMATDGVYADVEKLRKIAAYLSDRMGALEVQHAEVEPTDARAHTEAYEGFIGTREASGEPVNGLRRHAVEFGEAASRLVEFMRAQQARSSELKHGPGGNGLSGPCDVGCRKCIAERAEAAAPNARVDVRGSFRVYFNLHQAAPLVWCVALVAPTFSFKADSMADRIIWEIAVRHVEIAAQCRTVFAPKATADADDGKPSAWLEASGRLTVDASGEARIA